MPPPSGTGCSCRCGVRREGVPGRSPTNPAVQESGGGTAPKRHRFDLPRGRGPSQTPKFLSPGPPSPWLTALPKEKLSCHFCSKLRAFLCAGYLFGSSVSAAGGLMPGCRGRSPRRNKVIFSPFPPGRGLGGWGQESKLKTGLAGDKKGKPPAWHLIGRGCKRRAGSAPGDARGEAPCIKITLVSPFPAGEGGWGDRGAGK